MAVLLGVAAKAREARIWAPAGGIAIGLIVVAIALSALAARYGPATFVVSKRERAFVAPPGPQAVLLTASFTLLGGLTVADAVSDIGDHELWWQVDAALAIMWVLLVGLLWRAAGGERDLRLRPDGVLNPQLLGSQFIPWEAFAPAFPISPGNRTLTANYQRPDLVRRRGITVGRNTLPATVDAALLSRVVHEYVNHPERRTAFGTEEELLRVTAGAGG
ncbi:hypothetical protein CLV70_107249 [Pseudosporangium ferrugineum]|uniref:PH (Pleckstrin Homology) domain-containing protein n=1 Tax=Pseudosporangium ferrugineum TaxID=439699 RepID=A0A2T0S6M3_9ACTN|nr:hypothetical protein CLV70_107249 [Pseudosporangium ferrugineum]